MALQATQHFPVHAEFSSRALELGIASWLCDAACQIIAEPDSDPITRILCRSPLLRERIEAFAAADAVPKLSELFPGFFFLCHKNPDGTTISLLLTEDVLNEPQFLQIVHQVQLNRDSARLILSKLIHRNREDAERIATVLKHYDRDLAKSRRDQQVVHQFNTQLSQSFEEISMLFKTAQILNSVNDPVAAISLACDEFASTIPFAWIAIWFRDNQQVAAGLRGRLTETGPLPCCRDALSRQADEMCANAKSSDWKEVLIPGRHEFATSIASEILAEPILREGAAVGLLLAGNKTNNDPEISSSEIQFMRATANFIAVFHENRARFDEQRVQFLGTLHALAATIDAKDHYTRGHSQRVSILASKMAARLKLPTAEVEQYRIAGLLHDIGKIGVPEAVLQKCGKLTDDEFAQIKKHPQIGFHILKDVPSLEHILPGVLHHHERWDGRGYPGGLREEQIPLIARCLAFADTFDAMSSSRSYRKALPREQTLIEIKRSASTQFDPALVEDFLSTDFKEFDQLLALVNPPCPQPPNEISGR